VFKFDPVKDTNQISLSMTVSTVSSAFRQDMEFYTLKKDDFLYASRDLPVNFSFEIDPIANNFTVGID